MTTFIGHPLKPPGSCNGITKFEGLRGHVDRLTQIISTMVQGRFNCNLEFTLTAGAATSTLTDKRIHKETNPILVPMTANAAAEIGNGTLYPSTITGGSIIFTHANNGQADRRYRISLIG